MVGISELALMEEMSDTAHEYIQQIHDFGNDLAQLLATVLAQTDRGNVSGISTKEEYSPLDLVDELKSIAEGRVGTAVLEYQLEGDVPSALYGDDMRLQQTLLNLVLSTMNVVPSTQLTLSCTPIDDENTTLKFVVTDPTTVLSDAHLTTCLLPLRS